MLLNRGGVVVNSWFLYHEKKGRRYCTKTHCTMTAGTTAISFYSNWELQVCYPLFLHSISAAIYFIRVLRGGQIILACHWKFVIRPGAENTIGSRRNTSSFKNVARQAPVRVQPINSKSRVTIIFAQLSLWRSVLRILPAAKNYHDPRMCCWNRYFCDIVIF